MANNQNNNTVSRATIIERFIEILVFGLMVYFIQAYFTNSWAPTTAAETLKRENYINSKRETYFEALNLVNREISGFNFDAALDTTKYKRMKGAQLPTEYEVNSCLTKLHIYSDNEDIVKAYKKIFSLKGRFTVDTLITYQTSLLNNIKSDLSDKDHAAIANYEYIVVKRDTTFH